MLQLIYNIIPIKKYIALLQISDYTHRGRRLCHWGKIWFFSIFLPHLVRTNLTSNNILLETFWSLHLWYHAVPYGMDYHGHGYTL